MYKITAQVKKGMQSWGTVILYRDFEMNKNDLIKSFESYVIDFEREIKVDVEVKNFQCIKI
ncbi:hypothetical protein C7375_102119 [Frischella perrara]|uniref:Uncharacterized protein n=1 Tax=Frischella perrara TaxID=1267021 RepID=A0A0A7RZA0_FRIPE|nr:hypothetical protein FPB0191_00808 [Frischella perrara]PWV65044.1 hypothetical protein C7375_102119 [Frischella perrara]